MSWKREAVHYFVALLGTKGASFFVVQSYRYLPSCVDADFWYLDRCEAVRLLGESCRIY